MQRARVSVCVSVGFGGLYLTEWRGGWTTAFERGEPMSGMWGPPKRDSWKHWIL
jgi:hypothetical protein